MDQDKPVPKSRTAEMPVKDRRALWLALGMLSVSMLLVVLGVYTTTRTESLKVTGYASGVILALGSFLGILGLHLEENRKQLLTSAIVFLSFGTVASFLCLLIDGVCIAFNMDMGPLKAGRCQFYSAGRSYIYGHYYTSVPCWNLKETCNMTVRSGTCYCCDLYNCANGDYLSNYYEFVGVEGCQDVLTLYILVWTLTSLNLLAFFTGIMTAAVLDSIKGLRSNSPMTELSESGTSSPTAPLLMDATTHAAHQPHPRDSMRFPLGGGPLLSGSFPASAPPPFAPLPYKVDGFSA